MLHASMLHSSMLHASTLHSATLHSSMLHSSTLHASMLHAFCVLLQVEKECERLKVNLEQEKSARYSVVPNMVPQCTTAGATAHTGPLFPRWPPCHRAALCAAALAHAAGAVEPTNDSQSVPAASTAAGDADQRRRQQL